MCQYLPKIHCRSMHPLRLYFVLKMHIFTLKNDSYLKILVKKKKKKRFNVTLLRDTEFFSLSRILEHSSEWPGENSEIQRKNPTSTCLAIITKKYMV